MHHKELRHEAAPAAKATDGAGTARHAPTVGRRERSARHRLQHKTRGDSRAADAFQPGAMEDATRQSVRKGVISMVLAAALLLVFNSAGLRSWARGLPGNVVTDVLVESADLWHGMMQRAGVATAMDIVQDAVAGFRDQSWPGADIHATGKADVPKDE